MKNSLPSIILGSGQFIGVNHLSHERGDERANKFKNINHVIELINIAKEIGYSGIMFSTHPHSLEIIQELSKNAKLKDSFLVYPNLPYIQKYVAGANEMGMIGFVFEMIKKGNARSLLRASTGVITKNIFSMIKSLIDIELNTFSKVQMGTVFLHNVLTDIIASLELDDIIHLYIDHIQKTYGVKAGFVTLNLPKLSEYFCKLGIVDSVVQAPVNKIGFQMNPNLSSNIDTINNFKGNIIAMSTLAAGYIHPSEAYKFISELNNVNSIIVGGSSQDHLSETYKEIKGIYSD